MTAQQAVLADLRFRLLNGDLEPGERLLQEAIAERMGVSVVPVREALKTLESEGLVEYRPRRGFYVTELSLTELLEICDIRSSLEGMALERALPLLTDDDIARMEVLHRQMVQATEDADVIELTSLDRQFHFVVYDRAGLPRLVRLVEMLWDQSDPYRAMFFGSDDLRSANLGDHLEILEATRDRDLERLSALLDVHRRSTIRRLGHVLAD
jgi:DNA-binding GntR family transcriptional regulator